MKLNKLEDIDKQLEAQDCGISSKYSKPDDVLRPGRLYRGEKKYVGNSSMAPRKTHKGKTVTIRAFRKGLKKKYMVK